MGKEDNDSFYECFGLSRQAFACLETARELIQRSREAVILSERLHLLQEALLYQRQAIQLLKESDRLLWKQAPVEIENKELVTHN